MKPDLLEARYYETYYIANVISNVLTEPFDYLRNLDEFYGDLKYVRFLEPFQRFSALHQFIEFVTDALIYEGLDNLDLEKRRLNTERFAGIPREAERYRELPINGPMRHYSIEHQSFVEWLSKEGKTFEEADEDDAMEYYTSLSESGAYDALLSRTVDEVFFIMFLNRQAFMRLHALIAGAISDVGVDEVEERYRVRFARDGVLRRHPAPEWVKKAVYYRDRGRCVLCNKDLSGLVSLQNEDNFDHLVALARGGINDVTNLQLLCAECNRRKSDGAPVTSAFYEKWY